MPEDKTLEFFDRFHNFISLEESVINIMKQKSDSSDGSRPPAKTRRNPVLDLGRHKEVRYDHGFSHQNLGDIIF
jgi:hypothetical protein